MCKSISNFKTRKGSNAGVKVTLRSNKMYEFIDRLVNIALPRIKDFRGLTDKGVDKSNNFSFGIKEHIIFPEVNFDKVDKIRGLDITIVTSSKSKEGLTDEVYEKGFADYVASFKPYQAAHGWYGLKSESDKSVWDGVLLGTRANLDNTMSSKLNSTPVCDDFFNRTINCN